jgi:hypothetical protein
MYIVRRVHLKSPPSIPPLLRELGKEAKMTEKNYRCGSERRVSQPGHPFAPGTHPSESGRAWVHLSALRHKNGDILNFLDRQAISWHKKTRMSP